MGGRVGSPSTTINRNVLQQTARKLRTGGTSSSSEKIISATQSSHGAIDNVLSVPYFPSVPNGLDRFLPVPPMQDACRVRHPHVTLDEVRKWYATFKRPQGEKLSLPHPPGLGNAAGQVRTVVNCANGPTGRRYLAAPGGYRG